MVKQIGTKEIEVGGQMVTVKVFAPKQQLRERVESARANHNFELEAEARAEARYQGIDLGVGYSAW